MKQLLLFLLISSVIIGTKIGKDKKIISKDKWVSDLITLAQRRTTYNNQYPYNLLYYDGTYWSADCVNIMKALFNGRNINDWTKNGFQRDLTNTGDITTEEMIEKCTSVSSNFNALKLGEPRILHLKGHIGGYLGKNIIIDGAVYNVVEATGAFGRKIAFSWVDSDGTRRNRKGGSANGRWTRHGLPTRWVIY